MLAVERAFFDLAVVAGVVLVAGAGGVVERLLAVAVAVASNGAVHAERLFAVGAREAAAAFAFGIRARAAVTLTSVAVERAVARTAAVGRCSHPGGGVRVHAVGWCRQQEGSQAGRKEKDHGRSCAGMGW